MRRTTQGKDMQAPIRSINSIVEFWECESAAVTWEEAVVEFRGAVFVFRGTIVAFEVIVAFFHGKDKFRNAIEDICRACLYVALGKNWSCYSDENSGRRIS